MAEKKNKDWFDKDLAILLSEKIKPNYPSFDESAFVKNVTKSVKNLELKDRLAVIADELKRFLPQDYPEAADVLIASLGPENKKETGMFTEGYWIMPIATFVEKYGTKHFQKSMRLIREITKRNTGEYSIRPFIEAYPEKSMRMLEKWSRDSNVHVRRLASEGSRPRLPWAKKLNQFIENPKPLFVILENLKDDDSKYVQKSVANSFNDILKDNYEIAMKVLKKWSKNPTPNRKWIIKHALRNQIKKEVPEALQIVEQIEH